MQLPATTPAAWPTNPGAYRKVLAALAPTFAGLYSLGVLPTPTTLLAGAVVAASHVAVLLLGTARGKVVASWVGTVGSALVLAVSDYGQGRPFTWSDVLTWHANDVAAVGLLTVASLLHTVVPNAVPTPGPAAVGPRGDTAAAPVLAQDSEALGVDRVATTMLRAVPAAAVPAQPPAPAAEDLPADPVSDEPAPAAITDGPGSDAAPAPAAPATAAATPAAAHPFSLFGLHDHGRHEA